MILLVHSALRHTFAVKLKRHLYLRLFLSSTDSIQAFALPSPAPATHTLTSRQGPQWPPSCCISGHSWSTSPSTPLHMDTAICPLLLASLSSPGFLGIPVAWFSSLLTASCGFFPWLSLSLSPMLWSSVPGSLLYLHSAPEWSQMVS